MKYVLISLRGAIDSDAMIGFHLLDLVNVNWGIQWCVYVCVRACMCPSKCSANPRHDWFDLAHFGRYAHFAI